MNACRQFFHYIIDGNVEWTTEVVENLKFALTAAYD